MMSVVKTNADHGTIDLLHHGSFMDIILSRGWHTGMDFDYSDVVLQYYSVMVLKLYYATINTCLEMIEFELCIDIKSNAFNQHPDLAFYAMLNPF